MSSDKSLPSFNASYHPIVTSPPNPAWKLGDGISPTPIGKEWVKGGLQGYKSWDMKTMHPRDRYHMMTSAVVPRPMALVSTLSEAGAPNLAIFSFFNLVSANPPILGISFTPGRGPTRNSTDNIMATREFVINLVSEPFIEAANSSAVAAPMGFSEWKLAGLTMEPSVSVKPARAKESAVSFECELYNYQHIYPDNNPNKPSATLLLGRVRHAHARKDVLEADELQIDPTKCKMVSRAGGTMYGRMGDSVDMKIRAWEGVKEELEGGEGNDEGVDLEELEEHGQ